MLSLLLFHPRSRSTQRVMEITGSTNYMHLLQLIVLILYCFCLDFGTSTDTITSTHSIKDPETIVSNDRTFKLGFFTPVNATNRYVGIWYNHIPVTTVVWVANRNRPLNDSSGTVTISEDGNLVVLGGQNEIIWSSSISKSVVNSSAQLSDTGNLVLRDNSNGSIIWESFHYPSDSFLQHMKLGTDANTGENNLLTSWKSLSDPSTGSFSGGIVPLNIAQFFIWNGTNPHFRSGPSNGRFFIGMPNLKSAYRNGFNLVDNKEGTTYITFTNENESIVLYYVLNSDGSVSEKYWSEGMEDWKATRTIPDNECDFYGKCGPFGSCNSRDSPICTCLRGFVPKHFEEWRLRNWTSGCIRRTPLQCERNITDGERKEDGFLKLTTMKVPDFVEWSPALEDSCENRCLNNCSCVAYAYYAGIGCMQWSGTLLDIQKLAIRGTDLYIRVAYSELDRKREMKTVIAVTVIIGSVTIAICICLCWWWMAKNRGRKQENETHLEHSNESMLGDNMNQVKLEVVPMFNFKKLASATDNFHSTNKLGQGGFGPVYKGKLLSGQEIAIKRLSRSSGQGLQEFMNEVVVISKLQHRNLVRLLGCCVEGEEKMLIYEYMPNKSLDAFLFDSVKQEVLDWSKRVKIIEGICRGLLYLHRDSRLRIIHRDLKPSNILLDEELNPKISDFGMARIFGGNEDQANTGRVVGTYGYMAPEYAMEGRFSEKSDVYSFGVLLLEIVSGRRNNSFYPDEHTLSLLGFAWKLWNEDKIVQLIDPLISDPCLQMEILRNIHVGLLCVQEFSKDRPTISTVLSMLSSEIADLPTPKQPAFIDRQTSSEAESSQQGQKMCSINNFTITNVGGR